MALNKCRKKRLPTIIRHCRRRKQKERVRIEKQNEK